MPWNKKIHQWILYHSWFITLMLEIQETKYSVKIFNWSRVSFIGFFDLWATVASIFVKYFLISISQPASVFYDIKSAIYLAHNPTFHERRKNIELDCHVIRKKLQSKLIHLFPISTTAQLADIFTKPLHSLALLTILIKLKFCNIHSAT